jgi:prepilin-type N-terminal cleavage/methylation domain-containing protein
VGELMHRVHRAGPASGKRGFSLLEVMIASSVLGFGLLALSSAQLVAMRHAARGHYVAEATALARDQLDQIQRLPFATVFAAAGTGWVAVPWITEAGYPVGAMPVTQEAGSGGQRVTQLYSLSWRVSTIVSNPRLLNVDVEATWQDAIPTTASRTGLPTVTLASVRYDR